MKTKRKKKRCKKNGHFCIELYNTFSEKEKERNIPKNKIHIDITENIYQIMVTLQWG